MLRPIVTALLLALSVGACNGAGPVPTSPSASATPQWRIHKQLGAGFEILLPEGWLVAGPGHPLDSAALAPLVRPHAELVNSWLADGRFDLVGFDPGSIKSQKQAFAISFQAQAGRGALAQQTYDQLVVAHRQTAAQSYQLTELPPATDFDMGAEHTHAEQIVYAYTLTNSDGKTADLIGRDFLIRTANATLFVLSFTVPAALADGYAETIETIARSFRAVQRIDPSDIPSATPGS